MFFCCCLPRATQAGNDTLRENAETWAHYTVKPNEILYNIARDHKMTVEDLKSQNGLTDNMIFPGDVLEVKWEPAPPAEQFLRVARRIDARVELGNKSDYVVSYWVLQEDKMKTKAVEERVLKTIEGSLNATVGITEGASAGAGGAAKREKETTTEREGTPYFLLSDYRLSGRPNDHAQKVAFPRDCTDLRVYAYFQRMADKRWVLYRDQVCSIGTGYFACILDATNKGIEPYL